MVRRAQLSGAQHHAADGGGRPGFFYHSQSDKACVGIVEVMAEAAPDSTDDSGKWECVTVKAVQPLPQPVTLAQVKTRRNWRIWRW